jgi:hypothetical protein
MRGRDQMGIGAGMAARMTAAEAAGAPSLDIGIAACFGLNLPLAARGFTEVVDE